MNIRGHHVLIVEDEYMLAMEMLRQLTEAGAVVVGPEPSVARALSRLAAGGRIDAAVLDVHLGDGQVYPVAEVLTSRGIPFVFASGYGEQLAAERYPRVVNCQKPLDVQALIRVLENIRPQ